MLPFKKKTRSKEDPKTKNRVFFCHNSETVEAFSIKFGTSTFEIDTHYLTRNFGLNCPSDRRYIRVGSLILTYIIFILLYFIILSIISPLNGVKDKGLIIDDNGNIASTV